jgi:hypothetical protein
MTSPKPNQSRQTHLWCVSGKVNSADKIYLVIESVKTDTKNRIAPQNQLKLTTPGVITERN